jgi:Flp pilus assembly pilin Flp
MRFPRRLLDQDAGEGLAEYAILIALVAICLIGVINVFRSAVGELLSNASTDVAHSAGTSYVPPVSPPLMPVPARPVGGGGGGTGGVGTVIDGWEGAPPPDSTDAGDPELPDSLGVDSLGVE